MSWGKSKLIYSDIMKKEEMAALEEQKLRDKIRDMDDKRNKWYALEEELLCEISSCEKQ